MPSVWQRLKSHILTIDGIVAIVLVAIALYFIITAEKKKYDVLLPEKALHYNPKDPFLTGIRSSSKRKKRKRKINKHEERCREIFQDVFGVQFKSVRPKWLKNPVTNKNLELDGYNKHIRTSMGKGLAFEYDGLQHSKYVPHFHKNGPDEFEYQVAKDSWKDQKCKERGVMLIRIPHFVDYSDLDRYINNQLKKKGLMGGRSSSGRARIGHVGIYG